MIIEHPFSVLPDVDLVILGKSSTIYDRYADQIRREYAQYSDSEFAAGRCDALGWFRGRERIYRNPWFSSKYEAAAHDNLDREHDKWIKLI